MHWSLDQVRDLDADDFKELCDWLRDRADQSEHKDSMDIDQVIAAKKAKEARDGSV